MIRKAIRDDFLRFIEPEKYLKQERKKKLKKIKRKNYLFKLFHFPFS